MLSDLTGPVILVGSQRSSDRPSTDANLNLVNAGNLAVNSDLGEVVVAMHATTSDTEIAVHRGCRVRKMHTSSRDAFCSVNEEPIGYINKNEITLLNHYKKRSNVKVEIKEKMNENVALFYSYPGISSHYFDYLAEKNKGIVIAGTGLGHVSKDLIGSIRSAISSHLVVIMTSQCLFGRVNMNVYSSGRDLLSAGVISGEDMLPETAYVKLMWGLGQTNDINEVKELMQRNIAGEMGQRRSIFI